jgi:hypothetical protein
MTERRLRQDDVGRRHTHCRQQHVGRRARIGLRHAAQLRRGPPDVPPLVPEGLSECEEDGPLPCVLSALLG